MRAILAPKGRLMLAGITLVSSVANVGALPAVPMPDSTGFGTTPAQVETGGCKSSISGRTLKLPNSIHSFGNVHYLPALPLAKGEYVLTFDDGPTVGQINNILAILDEYCVKATFMMVGIKAQAHPELVRLVAQRGHTIGSHSMHHRGTPNATDDFLHHEMLDGVDAVDIALSGHMRRGNERRFVRTPGEPGWTTPAQPPSPEFRGWMESRGLVEAEYDISPQDWRNDQAEASFARLMSRFPDRGVILMHDWPSHTPELLTKTLDEIARRNGKIVLLVL